MSTAMVSTDIVSVVAGNLLKVTIEYTGAFESGKRAYGQIQGYVNDLYESAEGREAIVNVANEVYGQFQARSHAEYQRQVREGVDKPKGLDWNRSREYSGLSALKKAVAKASGGKMGVGIVEKSSKSGKIGVVGMYKLSRKPGRASVVVSLLDRVAGMLGNIKAGQIVPILADFLIKCKVDLKALDAELVRRHEEGTKAE